MSIRSSPLLGYNNNVRHKGKIFHIQTEDSGAKYGHIMTHLFTDGGRILKSVKTSYAEYVGNDRMTEIVREMMKQQHKAMFIALRDGKFDGVADLPADSALSAPVPSLTYPARGPTVESRSPTPPTVGVRPAAPPPVPPRTSRADRNATPPAAPTSEAGSPLPAREQAEELALDIDALERAAAVDEALPSQRSSSDLPPPPSKLLREKTSGPGGLLPGMPPPLPPSRTPTTAASAPPASERRYAPTRPASIFGQARPLQGKSIFGEDLISDKSLDEVILSYLADDLEEDDK
jgi:hypothetical protein